MRLPFQRSYVPKIGDGEFIDLQDQLKLYRLLIENMAESFAFAMLQPSIDRPNLPHFDEWDSPYVFTWFVYGWGPEGHRYIADAVRKLRALLRTGNGQDSSTLALRHRRLWDFVDCVESQDADGNFPWGDFPHGGAVCMEYGSLKLAGAVGGPMEFENDMIARFILGGLAKEILTVEGLLIH